MTDIPSDFQESWKSISWESVKATYLNASSEQKLEMTANFAVILTNLKKGKLSTRDVALLGGNSKYLYLGGYKIVTDYFHKTIKPNILSEAGNFSKTVGKNPNINVKNGMIILEGQGPFKGKSFKTTLEAKDFF